MKRSSSPRVTGALVAALAATACAGGAGSPGTPPAPASAAAPAARRANPAAVEFMSGMIHHHAQAIEMANLAVPNNASPSIRTLGQRIIISQRDEIGLMQTWLRDNGEPAPEPNPKGMTMMMGGMQHDMLMPGMLTEAQMAELARARGADFDRLFVTGMIQHHQGAIEMVEKLFASHGGTEDELIYKFASDVFADQSSEIDRMQSMLAAMPAGRP